MATRQVDQGGERDVRGQSWAASLVRQCVCAYPKPQIQVRGNYQVGRPLIFESLHPQSLKLECSSHDFIMAATFCIPQTPILETQSVQHRCSASSKPRVLWAASALSHHRPKTLEKFTLILEYCNPQSLSRVQRAWSGLGRYWCCGRQRGIPAGLLSEKLIANRL